MPKITKFFNFLTSELTYSVILIYNAKQLNVVYISDQSLSFEVDNFLS